MAKYQAYAEYKDSGVEFLPILPSTWKVRRVKSILDLQRTILGEKSKYYQLLSLTLRGVILRDVSGGDGKIPESFDTYQAVKKKDLVFCLFDMDETPRTVGISEHDGMITGAYNVYKVNKSSFPKFIYYYFLHLDYFKGLKPFYTGLRKVVRSDTFANIKMPCPPLAEQTQIANFLDHETTKIDHLIEKQQQLIELLKEKRQAVISHAVTKGLNPNVPMKDSGVAWLGEVPGHWQVIKFGMTNQSAVLGGNYISSEGDDGVPVIKMGNLGRGNISLVKVERLQKNEAYESEHLLKKGDFLFNTRNSLDLVGKVSIWREELDKAVYNSNILRVSFNNLIGSSEYASYLFNSELGLSQLRLIAKGTTNVAAIYYKDLRGLIFAYPPAAEQNQIVSFLDDSCASLDTLIEKAQSAIKLIQERRTALISAAVTGKIDVRNWQAQTVVEADTELST
ncbi:restriction endonuclease subunit S [Acinetobacter indicus]|uniref:restriction endonuclease subunit S n=1 Tax=Acinetobacter indicus TaxID=756892 RepID=UPI001443D4BC|nr:restriction endonuclease subunit S [Acinetobacter indicus]